MRNTRINTASYIFTPPDENIINRVRRVSYKNIYFRKFNMFKILFCFALSAVAASASPVSSSLECDDDLLYWAREDIFQNSVSVDIENELISCGNTLPNWLNPLPCPNSCEELICKYSCAIRKYDFVNIQLKFFSYKFKI